MNKTVRTWFVVLAALAIVAAACGSDDETPSGESGGAIEPAKTYDSIGETEGSLELIAWAGYVEDGTSEGGEDFDWVTPFEDETGCQVNVTYGDTSDEMVTLMRQGGGTVYDGVSASGDASVRLIAGGDVGAIDTSLFPQFANVIGPLNPDGGTNNRALRHRRQRVRDPVHVRAELPDVQHRGGHARPDELGRDVRDGLAVRGLDHRLRLADLHRRRGHVPDGAQPRPGDHRPVRALAGAVRRGGRAAEDAGRDGRPAVGALHGRDRRLRGRVDARGHGMAVSTSASPSSTPRWMP